MIGLTEQQRRLLDYLEHFMARSGGLAPTFTQMMIALGMTSKSGVHRLLSALVERGAIRRIPHRARAIEIIPQRANLRGIATDDLLAELARRGVTTLQPGLATTRPVLLPGSTRDSQQTGGPGLSDHRFHATEVSHV